MADRETKAGASAGPDAARDNEEHELEAEQESAEAMDAETSHGADDRAATEGQPS